MYRNKMETRRQTASNHTQEHCCTMPEQRTSFRVVPADFQSEIHCGEERRIASRFADAKAQRRHRHAEAIMAQYRADFEAGICARRELASHIYKSLPVHFRTSTSSLPRFWYAMHHGVARLALAQVHRSARRLGLKQIEDSEGFVRDHCGWYAAFSALSRWICTALSRRKNMGRVGARP